LVASLQELEKFKFVLEYSIGELRGQLDPKAAELADMRDKVAVSGSAYRCRGRIASQLLGVLSLHFWSKPPILSGLAQIPCRTWRRWWVRWGAPTPTWRWSWRGASSGR